MCQAVQELADSEGEQQGTKRITLADSLSWRERPLASSKYQN